MHTRHSIHFSHFFAFTRFRSQLLSSSEIPAGNEWQIGDIRASKKKEEKRKQKKKRWKPGYQHNMFAFWSILSILFVFMYRQHFRIVSAMLNGFDMNYQVWFSTFFFSPASHSLFLVHYCCCYSVGMLYVSTLMSDVRWTVFVVPLYT